MIAQLGIREMEMKFYINLIMNINTKSQIILQLQQLLGHWKQWSNSSTYEKNIVSFNLI